LLVLKYADGGEYLRNNVTTFRWEKSIEIC